MDTTNYPTIEPGLRTKYRMGRGLATLEGRVRIVGPLDGYGGAHMLDESGEPMDYMSASDLADPAIFWAERKPAGPPVRLSPLSTTCTFRATVTLEEPVDVHQGYGISGSTTLYRVTEVIVVWDIALDTDSPRWWPRAVVKGHRVLKSGQVSKHATSLYGDPIRPLESEAIDASRPVSTPSITWSK